MYLLLPRIYKKFINRKASAAYLKNKNYES